MRNARFVIVVSALVLVVSACGGQSAEEQLLEEILENSGEGIEDIDISTDGEGGDFSINIEGQNEGQDFSISGGGTEDDFEITISGEDGEQMTFGGGEIPDELTIPVPDGGEVTMALTSGTDANVAMQYPSSEYDRLVAFYDSTFDVSSDAVDRQESTVSDESGTFRSVYWNDADNYNWTVSVADCFTGTSDEPDAVCVTIFETSGE